MILDIIYVEHVAVLPLTWFSPVEEDSGRSDLCCVGMSSQRSGAVKKGPTAAAERLQSHAPLRARAAHPVPPWDARASCTEKGGGGGADRYAMEDVSFWHWIFQLFVLSPAFQSPAEV